MIGSLCDSWRQWRALGHFKALGEATRAIVFYAEDATSYVHFEKLIEHLTGQLGREICYLTSAENDPVLRTDNPRIHAFWIGAGTVRTIAFAGLQADVCVMTMPSLESFHIKRSRVAAVHYVYVFHSLVSTHMIYLKDAFDNFDTIFCAGPHHNAEIRAAERQYDLRTKSLLDAGYGHLDRLLEMARTEKSAPRDHERRQILIAPSWGPHGLLESGATPLIQNLLDAGYRIVVRPHPVTTQRNSAVIDELKHKFGGNQTFRLETDISSNDSFWNSDLMISDWSGAALEFAFALERPVLFIDVPRKVNNPDYEQLPCTPIEVEIREQIGAVRSPDDLAGIVATAARLCKDGDQFARTIREARARYVYNPGDSGRVGAEAIARIADQQRQTNSDDSGRVASSVTHTSTV